MLSIHLGSWQGSEQTPCVDFSQIGVLIDQAAAWFESGSRLMFRQYLISIRQPPDKWGCCLISIWQLPDRWGSAGFFYILFMSLWVYEFMSMIIVWKIPKIWWFAGLMRLGCVPNLIKQDNKSCLAKSSTPSQHDKSCSGKSGKPPSLINPAQANHAIR